MSFPDLPANDCRHRAALDSVDPGASNPSGAALAIHNARRQVMSEGGDRRKDAAVRLTATRPVFLVQGDSDLDPAEYRRLMDVCRARTAERPYPPAGEAAA